MSDEHIDNVVEKSVKLTLELEKWKSGFEEKISLLEIELQNEKNANAEWKKKIENLETMLNETSGEIKSNIETISSTMTSEHQLLKEQFEKMMSEDVDCLHVR